MSERDDGWIDAGKRTPRGEGQSESEQWPEPKEASVYNDDRCYLRCDADFAEVEGWRVTHPVVVVDAEMWRAVLEALAIGVVAADNAGYHVPYQAIRDLLERLPDGVRAQLEGGE